MTELVEAALTPRNLCMMDRSSVEVEEEAESPDEGLIWRIEDYCYRHGGLSPSLVSPNLRNGSEHGGCLDPGGEVLGQLQWLSSG